MAAAEGAASAVPRSGPGPERGAPHAMLWEDFYRSASPAQQVELLSLAARQGLLYAHQFPSTNNGTKAKVPEPSAGPLHLLANVLEGHTQDLAAVFPPPVAVHDIELDAGQREAVARAIGTPDLCLIQGLPGTGKSRVAAEIIVQAAVRGQRVLLLAPGPAALDRVLEILADCELVCPVRCLGADEKAEHLPSFVRAMTFAEKVRSLREQSVQCARQGREQAEHSCRRRQQEGSLWPRLLELAESWQQLDNERAALRERQAQVPEQVRREAGAVTADSEVPAASPFIAALVVSAKTRRKILARIDAALEGERLEQTASQQILEKLEGLVAPLRPLAVARQQGRWWSPARWWALLHGDVVGRLVALESQIETARAALKESDETIQGLSAERATAEQGAQAEWAHLVDAEAHARQEDLDAQQEALAHEAALLQNKWDNLCQELELPGERPAAPAVTAVNAAHGLWQAQAGQDEERCTFARQWAAYLEGAAENLATRLPDYTNLVASTTATLAGNPHFGDAAAGRQNFDLLILDDATFVTESEFLQAARRASRWVLIGQPTMDGEQLPAPAKPASSKTSRSGAPGMPGLAGLRCGFFQRLWHHLHADPSRLPYAWVQEGERICCRLRTVAPDQRRWVESERVADFPEIELRILALPRLKPALAEVVFPAAMSIHEAKEYLYRELQEFPVQTPGRCLKWHEEPERLLLRLARAPGADAQPVLLEQGVREWVGCAQAEAGGDRPAAVWHTCRIEFERSAGWDRVRAEAWIHDRLQIRDLGRTACLEVPHRMRPALAAVLWDLLFDEVLPAERDAGSCPAVEFVAVPPLTRGRGLRDRIKAERAGRGVAPSPLAGNLPRSGAGLELDLAAPRHGDRLPSELRAGLPGRGFVNYLEAQAVVRRLEKLLADVASPLSADKIAIVALYPAQVELIRRLIQQAAPLQKIGASIPVELPGAFQEREWPVILLSLTRSHAHRTVTFGESPRALALAMTRARTRLILFGDPGTCARRSQWQGALDHLDDAAAGREGLLITRLVRYLQGQGRHPRALHLSEGSSA